MKFALVDNKRSEAKPGLKDFCRLCSQSVIAKCGTIRVRHWAHINNKMCDRWWEPETEWHRSWKNNFPEEWQEFLIQDEKRDKKHIADVRTDEGLVIEFQHSHIAPPESAIREQFYENMVWVVDGTRLERDLPRFLKGQKFCFDYDGRKQLFQIYRPEKVFPSIWLNSSVPVVFDFKSNESLDELEDIHNYLYCLFPSWLIPRSKIFAKISRSSFITNTKNGKWLSRVRNFIDSLNQPNTY